MDYKLWTVKAVWLMFCKAEGFFREHCGWKDETLDIRRIFLVQSMGFVGGQYAHDSGMGLG